MCYRHDEDDLFEPNYLAVSFGVSRLEKTGVIPGQYIDLIVARHVLDRRLRSRHPIDVEKPCAPCGANTIIITSERALGIITLQLPEED
jgi:hypothetical protein